MKPNRSEQESKELRIFFYSFTLKYKELSIYAK
jgi:hypothetical protein